MKNNSDYSSLKAAVGTSTKKNSYEAGIDVAEKVLKKLKDKPDFILLFCTGDYEKSGGYEKLLEGIWKILPEGTQLVGGLTNGFLNTDGCFAAGVTALAVSYPNMNIVIGSGKNTKRNPKKAANQCIKMIESGLENKYTNKILFSFISAIEIPKTKSGESSPIIKSRIMGKIMPGMLSLMQKTSQKGFGREDEILKELSNKLPDFNIIHESTISMINTSLNYQFFNKKVLTESVICLAIESDLNFNMNFANAAEKMDVEFKITKVSKDKHFIKKINRKPAFPEFLRIMNWSEQDLEQTKWVDTTSRYPLSYYKDDNIFLRPILMITGNYLGCLGKIESNNIFMAKMSSSKMIESIDELLTSNNPELGFFVSCVARQGFLGSKVFQIQEKLQQYFQDKPFLLLYGGGEGLKKSGQEVDFLTETITSAIFEKSN